MGDSSQGQAVVVCPVCNKAWPADRDRCPDDGTVLGRRAKSPSVSATDVNFERAATDPQELFENLLAGTDVPTRSPELENGARVGEYEIEMKIGEGAMGTVYRATHPAIGKQVAIKVISPRVFEEKEAVRRFVAEARAVAAIRHPGIVHVFGFGRLTDGRTYLTMEWLEGRSLGAQIAEGQMPLVEALDIIRQIARALEAAHAKDIVHRDLKPENVFLQHVEDEPPIVKLLDFGLAKVNRREDMLVARTRTGQILGTPLYMSPEQCRNKNVDQRTDIYALGCMCYELLAGRVPFDHDNSAELISAHLTQEPPLPSAMGAMLPRELEALLPRMIAKNPDSRPTLAEIRRTIAAVVGRASQPIAVSSDLAARFAENTVTTGVGIPVYTGPTTPPARSSRPLVIAVIAGAAMVAIAIVAVSLRGGGEARPAAPPPAPEAVQAPVAIPDAAPVTTTSPVDASVAVEAAPTVVVDAGVPATAPTKPKSTPTKKKPPTTAKPPEPWTPDSPFLPH